MSMMIDIGLMCGPLSRKDLLINVILKEVILLSGKRVVPLWIRHYETGPTK